MPEWIAIWILATIGLAVLGFFMGVFMEDGDAGAEVFMGVVKLSIILFLLAWLSVIAIAALV